ncbi:MAG TPA: SEL1-like repeat protein, partial [Phenylobacterium sp.]
LTERIIQSERRAAQAIDDVGEQVSKVTERIEQRHERAASDVAERIRASEERTAKLLQDAQARLLGPLAAPSEAAEPQWDEARLEPEVDTAAPVALEAEAAPEEIDPPIPALDAPLPGRVFGPSLLSRAEPLSQPALDPSNPTFGAEDFEAADGFVPISEAAEERLERDIDIDERPADLDASSLSTREVIEQARAAARAAAAARPTPIYAGERRPRQGRPNLFAAFKPARPASTWQTALMVAGGAAFLSVGAAGVVLMEGPGAPRELPAFNVPPRAALALTPGPTVSAPEPIAGALAAADDAAQPAADLAADYLATARAVEQKKPGALAHLKQIAEGGHAPAQALLAHLYETGQHGVAVNLGQARGWMQRAAEAGEPAAMHNLALFYFRGEGGPQDPVAAARWFKAAAEHGVVDSQYNLGLLYAAGSGVPKDPAQAYRWFSIAANAGDGQAREAAVAQEKLLPTDRLAVLARDVAAFQPAGAAPAPPSLAYGPSVTAAQKILGRLGYYKGRPDGGQSHELKLAVSAYQRDQGLAATGSLDPVTVSRLAVFNR